jgi:hypothetical protein
MYCVLYIKSHHVYTTAQTNLNYLTLFYSVSTADKSNLIWIYAVLLSLPDVGPCGLKHVEVLSVILYLRKKFAYFVGLVSYQ